ncbi:MAG: enoyl-CoA hydratase [Candidatus Aminicenantes bacterium]|nr:enoyl-CoA hydratase [Candidatus Aminicenantes bacterium]
MEQYKNLKTEKDNNIGVIFINRPDKLNALNRETVKELNKAFSSFQGDDEVKAVVLTGSGEKAFVAGADIKELSGLDLSSGKEYVLEGQQLMNLIEDFKKPVIGAINGFALGGGTELALACHIRIASENAKMGQPEVKLGLIPGFGGTQRLPRLVGKGIAMEMILSGKTIDAQEAYRIGLVNEVISQDQLLPHCKALAQKMASNGPKAVENCIQSINKGMEKPLGDGLLLEAELFGKTCATEDSKEGTKAFLEKRKPEFRGK